METETLNLSQKAHRKRQAGSKLDKKKKKIPSDSSVSARQRNPKAFAYHSVNKVARQVRRFVIHLFCLLSFLQVYVPKLRLYAHYLFVHIIHMCLFFYFSDFFPTCCLPKLNTGLCSNFRVFKIIFLCHQDVSKCFW